MKILPPLKVIALGLVLFAGSAATPVLANPGDDGDHEAALAALQRGEILPLGRILSIVATRVTGDVIDVELERHHGVWRYEVKVLTSTGRVREVKLRAQDGVVLEIEDD
ncbi:PepSY domain-containing protein [Brevundimonas sp.]|uniref:PepSY domain-containing protein n=1 Tax=Brevundimonas sp. TaxID=1871086 RepID=UPI003D12867B